MTTETMLYIIIAASLVGHIAIGFVAYHIGHESGWIDAKNDTRFDK